MEDSDRENLLKAIDTAAGKVVNKMMFGLKDFMKEENLSTAWKGWKNFMKNKEKKMFPLFVDLTEKKILVVGAGKIASRRVKTLLPFAGEIVVEAPEAAEELLNLAEKGEILYRKKLMPGRIFMTRIWSLPQQTAGK